MIRMNGYSFTRDGIERGNFVERVHQLTIPTPFYIGDVHIYLIVGEVISLIDAGVKTEAAWNSLKLQLSKLNYNPEDIGQIFLTHHHPDHIGLVEKFPNAKIIAHNYVDYWLKQDKQFLSSYEQYYKVLLAKTGVPKVLHNKIDDIKSLLYFSGKGRLDLAINEGDKLPGHEDWQVVATKGHAQSHLSFYREKDGLFIGGDHLLLNTSPNPIIEAPYFDQTERPKPLLQYRKNLNKCLQLDITSVLPGHGKIFSEVDEYIKFQLSSQEKRANKVLDWLEKELLTAFDIARRLFPRHYESQLELTMSESIGQLDYLSYYEKVIKENIDGVTYYRAK